MKLKDPLQILGFGMDSKTSVSGIQVFKQNVPSAQVWYFAKGWRSSIKDVGIIFAIFDPPLPHVRILTMIKPTFTF